MQQDRQEKRFGEPEGVVVETRCGRRAKDGSGEKAETNGAKIKSFGEASFAGFRVSSGRNGIAYAFDRVAKIAGDKGGVVGKTPHVAIAGRLKGGDEGDDGGEGHVGKVSRKPAEGEEGQGLSR